MPDITTPTYTDYTGPSFTAGTLTDIDECIDYIESHLQRGSLASQTVPTLTMAYEEVTRAKQELLFYNDFSFKRRYAYTTTTASAYRYALPTDFSGGDFTLRDTTNNHYPKYFIRHMFDKMYPDMSEEANGQTLGYTIKGKELWTYPPTAAGVTFELEYGRSGDDSTQTDLSYIPQMYRYMICDRALSLLFRVIQKFDVAKMYEGDWVRMVAQAKKSDNRQKWAKGGQAVTWQQDHSARYNQ